jgi:hypothetical protein
LGLCKDFDKLQNKKDTRLLVKAIKIITGLEELVKSATETITKLEERPATKWQLEEHEIN